MGLAHHHGYNFGRSCSNSIGPVQQIVQKKVPNDMDLPSVGQYLEYKRWDFTILQRK